MTLNVWFGIAAAVGLLAFAMASRARKEGAFVYMLMAIGTLLWAHDDLYAVETNRLGIVIRLAIIGAVFVPIVWMIVFKRQVCRTWFMRPLTWYHIVSCVVLYSGFIIALSFVFDLVGGLVGFDRAALPWFVSTEDDALRQSLHLVPVIFCVGGYFRRGEIADFTVPPIAVLIYSAIYTSMNGAGMMVFWAGTFVLAGAVSSFGWRRKDPMMTGLEELDLTPEERALRAESSRA